MAHNTNELSERELMDRLVHQRHYTPEELSELTGISVVTIQRAVLTGKLRGVVVDHRCQDILREDVLEWLRPSKATKSGE